MCHKNKINSFLLHYFKRYYHLFHNKYKVEKNVKCKSICFTFPIKY